MATSVIAKRSRRRVPPSRSAGSQDGRLSRRGPESAVATDDRASGATYPRVAATTAVTTEDHRGPGENPSSRNALRSLQGREFMKNFVTRLEGSNPLSRSKPTMVLVGHSSGRSPR
jgi:hypothetical protein